MRNLRRLRDGLDDVPVLDDLPVLEPPDVDDRGPALLARPDHQGSNESEPPDPAEIAMPVRIRYDGTELSFLNTITTFGAAYDITLDDIVVEAYFPTDPTTVSALQAMTRPVTARRR